MTTPLTYKTSGRRAFNFKNRNNSQLPKVDFEIEKLSTNKKIVLKNITLIVDRNELKVNKHCSRPHLVGETNLESYGENELSQLVKNQK
tara:strand:+ start:351 stop:617 length:267 start_codon:yes stop_codon:yes gene_type:complete